MYSVFEYYSNNILFVFVFGHNSESEYYSYSYSAKYLCTNIIRIRIRSFWENKYYSYSYSVKILFPNNIRIRSKFWFRIIFVFVFGPKNSIRSPLFSIMVSSGSCLISEEKNIFTPSISSLTLLSINFVFNRLGPRPPEEIFEIHQRGDF